MSAVATRSLRAAAAMAVLGVVAGVTVSVVSGMVLLVLAGALVAVSRVLRRIGVGLRRTSLAYQHLTRGDLAEAEAVLASMRPRATSHAVVRRAVSSLRALVALYEGRPEEAVRHATAAIEARRALVMRTYEAAQIADARAVRALAHAALGHASEAKADADAAESSPHATPEVLARARLVRALLASRAAYHEQAFRAHLDANARLVLEHAMPRERALFRALRRMARSPHRGVYRRPGTVTGDRAPSRLAGWIAYVAPETAPYVDREGALAEPIEEAPIDSGVPSDVRALRTARASTSSSSGRLRQLGVLAAMAAIPASILVAASAVWHAMPPSTTPSLGAGPLPEATFASRIFGHVLVFGIAAFTFVIVLTLARMRERLLALARRQVAVGQRGRAIPTLARLALGSGAIEAATAGLELARIAASQADFGEAISRCDAAIARVNSGALRTAASDDLLPALMTESAVATASRGGLEDADAELAILCRDFPAFAHLAAARVRVQLVRAVRGGDRDGACRAARARTAEMALPYREDVLADLVLASRGEIGEEDLARLDAEVKEDAELRTWLDAVAPGLRDERGLQGGRARIAMRAAERDARSDAADATEAGETPSADATIKRIEANG